MNANHNLPGMQWELINLTNAYTFRLIINGTGLQTRQFTSSYDNTNFILNSYSETKRYVTYPSTLSSSAVPGHSYPTNPYSEDLFLTLCDIFSFGLNSFDKLTEIQLGVELSTRSMSVQDRFARLASCPSSCMSFQVRPACQRQTVCPNRVLLPKP